MSQGYTLTWKSMRLPMPTDGSILTPACDPMTATMPIGREQIKLTDLFEITGKPGNTLTLINPPKLDHLGSQMAGGQLIIQGDAGDDLGSSMAYGIIHVTGNCGDRVGGPANDQPVGIGGGEIVVLGNAGDHAGLLMRRGLIAIAGTCGKLPGYRMFAGTLVLGKQTCPHTPGLEMQRGTLLYLDTETDLEIKGRFAAEGEFALPVVRLILKRLQELNFPLNAHWLNAKFKLFTGNQTELNKAEIWQRVICRD